MGEEHTPRAQCFEGGGGWCGAGVGVGGRQKTGEEGPGWETMKGQKRAVSYFDFKGSFESTCKEPSEGADERGKGGESDAVDLERVHPDDFLRRINEVKSRCLLRAQPYYRLTKVSLYSPTSIPHTPS